MSNHFQEKLSQKEITTDDIRAFFDALSQQIEDDKLSMLTGTAPEAKAAMFEKFIYGDKEAIQEMVWRQTTRSILNDLFSLYLRDLNEIRDRFIALAFKLSGSTMNVFAVINDDDKDSLNRFILIGANLMPSFIEKGISLKTMVYEASDNISIPQGYKEFNITNSSRN